MLGGNAKTLTVSVLIHVAVIAVLASFAAQDVSETHAPESLTVEIEIIPAVTKKEPPPEPAVKPPTPDPIPVPTVERPKVVPTRTRVRVTTKPTPFQPAASEMKATREAPPDTVAVAKPTAPTIDMEATVSAGGANYSSIATHPSGTFAVSKGPGGPGHGPGGGSPGELSNQGAVGVKVSRDWQITQLPKSINARSFEPRYPPRARREKREARITVRLYIDDKGAVARAVVLDGTRGHGFRASALAYTRKLRFRPARAGTRNVAARIDWTVLFYVHN